MTGIFFTAPLARTSWQGSSWAYVDAYFPELQVFANIFLSAYRTRNSEQFAAFEPTWAEGYIVSPATPTTRIGGASIPTQRDSTVYVKTSQLTFRLQVNNASATAVGTIYDATPTFSIREPVQQLDFAVHEEDGTVLGTHRAVRLEGGPEIDEDEVRERVLATGYALAEREQGSLRVAAFDARAMATDTDFRINPSTGQAEPVGIEPR